MRASSTSSTIIVLLALICLPATSSGTTWNVPSDAATIQAGIDSATAGDTVLVAAGTYYENITMKGGIYVLGEAADPESTVVDAGAVGAPASFINLTEAAYLEGFTLTNGFANYGGGVVCINASPEILNCRIVDNHVNIQGGAILCELSAAPTFTSCLIAGNTSGDVGGVLAGYSYSITTFVNCTMHGNGAPTGGAIYVWLSSADIQNSIIAFGTSGEAVYCVAGGSASLSCSDLYGNASGDWVGCIAGQAGTSGNFSEDPSFCDAANGDFHIQDNSPCAPLNSGGCGLVGAHDVQCFGPISVAASDSTLESGVMVTWPQTGWAPVFYGVFREGALLSYLPGNATSYLDTSATVRIPYEYCVRMFDFSTYTEMSLGCNMGSRAFLAPSSVEASDGQFADKVRITWFDRSRIETGYEIRRQEPDLSWVLAGTTVANRGTFEDTAATPGTAYTYCVNAVRGSQMSQSDCDTGLSSIILAPGDVQATDGLYSDRVLITWEDRSDNETAFEITRDTAVIDSIPANSTSYEDLGDLGTEHTYCVRAIADTVMSPVACDDGVGGDSTMVRAGNVDATDGEFDDRVVVTWEDSTDVEDGFDIYRGGALIASLTADRTSYTDLEAPPGDTVAYSVVAVSDLGGSSMAAYDSGSRAVIVPPMDVSASDGAYEAYVEISWETTSTTVVLSGISRDGVPINSVSGSDHSVKDFDIVPGMDYDYCVWGMTATGDTSVHVCDTGKRELKAPTHVSASDDTLEDRIVITWTDVSEVETGYRIYRRDIHPDSAASVVGTTPVNRGIFDDHTSAPGVTYEYSVVAYDTMGESAPGTDTGSRTLLAPTMVEATDGVYEDRVKITWQGESFAESGYRIYRKYPDPDSIPVLVDTVDEYSEEYADTSPEFGIEYDYSVAAYDPYGESGRDSDAGHTTILPPSWVNASDSYGNRIVVTWVDNSKFETGYEVFRDDSLIAQTDPDVTTLTDSPSEQDVGYEYCVRAVSSGSILGDAGASDAPGHPSGLRAPEHLLLTDLTSESVCDMGMMVPPLPEPEALLTRIAPQLLHGDYGAAVGLDGDFLIVGSPNLTDGAGDAYILERDGADWVEVYNHGSSHTDSSYFGWSVAISGSIAVAGNPEHDSSRGAVHIIMRDEYGSWAETDLVVAGDGESGDEFGFSVAMDDSLMIVGARLGDGPLPGEDDAGAAYIFEYNGINWVERTKLTASSPQPGDAFGHSVDIEGELAIVGAPLASSGQGIAYIYSGGFGSWTTAHSLEPADLDPNDHFGWSVATNGGDVMVGAPTRDGNSGKAYLYSPYVNTWVLENAFEPPPDAIRSPLIGAYDTPGSATRVDVSGDHAFIADGTHGLHIVDISDPRSPRAAGSIGTADRAQGIAVSGNYAYVAASGAGLQVVDISIPSNPDTVGLCDTPGNAWAVAIYMDFAFVADEVGGLQVITVSNPQAPALLNTIATPSYPYDVEVRGHYAFVADCYGGLQIFDITVPVVPVSVGSYTTGDCAFDVAISGSYAYVTDWVSGLVVIDISDPAHPAFVGSYDPPGYSYGVAVSGDYAYVANTQGPYGLTVVDVSDPSSPTLVGNYLFNKQAIGVDISKDCAYLACQNLGLQVFMLSLSEGFGRSVALQQDIAVVGAPCVHAAHVYGREDTSWEEKTVLPTVADALSLDDVRIAIGDRLRASVDLYSQRTSGPATVTASAGDFEDRVRIEWQDVSPERSPYEGAFRIYRDGQLIESLGPGARSYNDFSADPGRTYEYGVAAFWEFWGESYPVPVHGRRPADGAVSGRVTARGGGGVDSVMVHLSPPPNSALLFDGAASYVEVEDAVIPEGALTVEFWLRGTDTQKDGWVMCYSTDSDPPQPLLGIGDYSDLVVRVNDNETPATGVQVNDGEWHHIAVTWRNSDGRVEIFKGGVSAYDTTAIATGFVIPAGGTLVIGQNPWQDFDEQYALVGQLDEVRIWDGVRTPDEIRVARKQPLSGEENGLIAYWPFDEGAGEYATADLTQNNSYGALEGALHWTQGTDSLDVCTFTEPDGSYAITDIRYGGSSALRVIPSMQQRSFDPAFRNLILDPESPIGNEVDFTDITSFTLAGRVRFRNTACPMENVELWVDGEVKGSTDKEGNFEIAVDPAIHVIEPRFSDHTFEPAARETLVLGDMHGLDFEDTVLRRLSGRVGGGCDLSFGSADIAIWTADACLDTTLAGLSQDYEALLPPRQYFAHIEDVSVDPGSGMDVVDVERFFENLGVLEIDLRETDEEIDFTYWAPLAIEIEGLPEVTCLEISDEDRGTVVPAVPIIAQGEAAELTISVFADYGDSGSCLVDSGTVTIFDEIMDVADIPVTLALEDGRVTYTTYGGYPNIFYGRRDADGNDRSYQKALTVVVRVAGREPITQTHWAIVTGDLPRTGTFVSATTEEFPLLIMRDPPGDGSHSFVESGRTITTTLSDMVCRSRSGSGGFGVKAGLAFGVSIGGGLPFGVLTWSISTEFAQWIETTHGWEVGVRATDKGAMELSLTTAERFSTSPSDLFVGPDGDVYLGVAMNLVFAKTDVLDIDQSGEPCKVVKSETVRFGVDDEEPFETIYLYTQDHIENTLIPQFEDLATLEPSRADEFELYAANWQSHLNRNDSLRTAALLSPRENRSFSAGATLEFTETVDSTKTFGIGFEVFSNSEHSLDFGFEIAGSGAHGFVSTFGAECSTHTETAETSGVFTVGYVLSDDDPGDYFSTDVGFDPAYGTPVFGLKSGRSSCPWETGTQPRDSLFMTIEPDSLEGVPPEEPAVFTLALTNASVSEETRKYVLYPVQTSNPGGALLRVNGETFHDGLEFTIAPDQTQEATLTVERGPSKYYYRNLKLVLVSACDEAIADTATFSVAFDAPCSDITLYRPEPGWSFNLTDADTSGNSMDLTLADFEMRVSMYDSLSLVGAEYRPDGTDDNPINIGLIDREDIELNPDGTPKSQDILWDLSGVDDGRYEVRGYTQCSSGGPVHSSFATGTIDRERPAPLGEPQPADGELALGDEISMTFSEPIRCSSVNPVNIVLECLNPDSSATAVDFDLVCSRSKIVIAPDPSELSPLEGKTLRASVTGIRDAFGNHMVARDRDSTEVWEFQVRRSAFLWSQADIIHHAAYRYEEVFAATLVNGTPEEIDFVITGVPDWLSPSATMGSMFSAESKEIAFSVSDTLSMGIYEDTLYAEVVGAVPEIVAPLHVTLEVACEQPVWIVDPAGFEHSMNVVAEISIGGVASQDTSDMLAAYVGNQLRGVASPVHQPAAAYDYLVYLTVYSDRAGGETIRFRVWDDDSCRMYTGTDKSFTFLADGHIGSPESPEVLVALDALPGNAQIIELSGGWTWFSLNLADGDMSVDSVLADLNTSTGDFIKSQSEFSQFDSDLGWVGSLAQLDNTSSYAISLNEAGTLIHEGTAVDPDTLPMPGSAGWQWIGYTPQVAMAPEDALSGLGAAQDDLIKSQYEFAQVDAVGSWLGTLDRMEPGYGYRLWLGAARPAWYYGSDSSGVPQLTAAGSQIEGGDDDYWQVDPHAYEHSMSVIGQIELDGAVVSDGDYLVGAFVEGEVRGVAPLKYVPQLERHLVFLMIHSNEAQSGSVTFKTYGASENMESILREDLDFRADEVVGSLDFPFIFTGTAGDTTGLPAAFSLAQNYPNPLTASSQGVIQYAVPAATHVVIRAYDVRGREVTTLVDKEQPAGWHHVELDPADFGSGIYFYRMSAGGFTKQRKMTVLR